MKFKKAGVLVSAIASTAVCASLIAGSTFALFSSSDKVDITVSSGKVSIEATVDETSLKTYSFGEEQAAGKFENGGTAGFNDKAEFVVENVTPGDSATFNIVVKNNSNVKVQYRVGYEVSGELAKVLQAKVTGAAVNAWTLWEIPTSEADKTKTLTVSVALPDTVGNEYQEKSASMGFRIEAIQGNASADVLDEYDTTHITQADVYEANNWNWISPYGLGESVKIVKLDANIDMGNKGVGIEVPKVNLNGKTIKSGQLSVFYHTVEICDGTIEHSDNALNDDTNYIGQHALYVGDSATVTLKNVTIESKEIVLNNQWAMYIENYGGGEGDTRVVIEDGCVLNGRIGMFGESAESRVYLTINGGEFNCAGEGQYIDLEALYNGFIEINGGTFNCNRIFGDTIDKSLAVINGGKFKCDPAAWVAEGHTIETTTDENGVTWYTVA